LGRILLLLIIVFLLWLIFRGFFRSQTKTTQMPAKTEDMVACARCGVNLPRSEARVESGIFYCKDNPRCLIVK